MNVEQALATAHGLGLTRLDAALLLGHHLQRRREWLIAHPQAPVGAQPLAAFDADCHRRVDGVPLTYLTGRREFMGLDLRVTADVLVPRPETETLAQWAIERLQAMPSSARPRVIDLGTGSGALALAIAAACPHAQVTATDCSTAALALARANAQRLGLQVQFAEGDWWSAAGPGRFDLAVANPPYIAEGDVHLAALRHEPTRALVAGAGGLDALVRIIEAAPRHLTGWLLVEHGWNQADDVKRLMSLAAFAEVEMRPDLNGLPRCTRGRTG
jgi:release factor glutamine methyltransferase